MSSDPSNLDIKDDREKLVFTWTAPTEKTDEITGYTIQFKKEKDDKFEDVVSDTKSKETTYTKSGFEPNTTYIFQVAALREKQTSIDFSIPITHTTESKLPPFPLRTTSLLAALFMAIIVIFLLVIPICSGESCEKYSFVVIPIVGVITFFGVSIISGSYISSRSNDPHFEQKNKSITRRSIASSLIITYLVMFSFVTFGGEHFDVQDFIIGDNSKLTEKNIADYLTSQNQTREQFFILQNVTLNKFKESSDISSVDDIMKIQNSSATLLLKFHNQSAFQTVEIQNKINELSKNTMENEASLMQHFLAVVMMVMIFYFGGKWLNDYYKLKYGKSASTPIKPKTIGELMKEKTPTTFSVYDTSETGSKANGKIEKLTQDDSKFILTDKKDGKRQKPWGVVQKKDWTTLFGPLDATKKGKEISEFVKKLENSSTSPATEWNDSGFDNIFEAKKEQTIDQVIKDIKGKDFKNLWIVIFNDDRTKTEAVYTHDELSKNNSIIDAIIQRVRSEFTQSS